MSSRGLPEALFKKVDEYVDSLAPQIQPRIASELEDFQTKTIDSLEDKVVDAFRSLFNKDSASGASRSLNDSAPDTYGGQSLPFADEIAKLTRSFGKITDEAGDDLRDIFNLTEGQGGGQPAPAQSRGLDRSDSSAFAKGLFSAAMNVVQDQFDKGGNRPGGGLQLDGLLGALSSTLKDVSRNPEDTARMISPEIKEKVGLKLREQHGPIAEKFTHIALDHIKKWLRGNTSARDLGDGAKGELEDQVKHLVKGIGGLFGHKKKDSAEGARGFGDESRDRAEHGEGESSGGFSKLISDKLSTGIAKVHREVRLEFRKVLGGLEKDLFELLPDEFQKPLEKILGGNPFDSQLDRDAAPQADRGFGDDIKTKLVSKIRDLVRKVQEMLRESILGVVSGGHRKLEHHSWTFVQNMVEQKVQKYLPKVKITVPDDIGNENVSVGAPTAGAILVGGQPSSGGPPTQGGHGPPTTSHQQHQPSGYAPPPTTHQENPSGSFAPPASTYNPPQTNYNPSQTNYYPPPPTSYEQHQAQQAQHGYNPQSQYQPQPQQHHQDQQGYNPQSQYQPPPQEQHHQPPQHGYNPQSQYPPPPQEQHHQPQHGYNPQSQYPPPPQEQHHQPQQGYNPSTYQQQNQHQQQQQQFFPPPPTQEYGQDNHHGQGQNQH
ncbi:hypothetical protein QBC42DRAFT_105544 [Cladorrhinum samala]|uniref:Uncharacterized protein n=1 Tax=Cladorrhinum samala TaxID=585594 RepID=A0AAV9HKK4_9PEZI|nr:hypothetical protein QBC42DRAFT_105544 [Cladorrhinum samala]